MKKFIILAAAAVISFTSCVELNLMPLTNASSDNWFNNAQEVEMALNALYAENYWYFDCYRLYNTDRWTDDWNQREYMYDYLAGEVSSTWGDTERQYKRLYQSVARTNTILDNIDNLEKELTEDQVNQYRGEACFFRAVAYSYLVFTYGDVPFYTTWISLDDAYAMARTDKDIVLEQVYKDFDVAIEYLPTSYSSTKRITKGAAYAFKARTCLWFEDWEGCIEACEGCINTNEYELESDFSTAVSTDTKDSKEHIFYIPRSASLGYTSDKLTSFIPRVMGGTANAQPSIDLFLSFLCTDGKTIDKSDVFDPLNPYENRDPRLSATFITPGESFFGYVIDPRPWVTQVTDPNGNTISNKDTRAVDTYAAYNTMNLKKGITEDWIDDLYEDGNVLIMRYADVLLMLAEAKCELNQLDDEAYNAINQVRARAYGVPVSYTESYPAVTTTSQSEFRSNVRIERRMEFAWENKRYFDLIRWRIADKALNKSNIGLSTSALKGSDIDETNWFLSADCIYDGLVDEDGVVDVTSLLGHNCFYQESVAVFDAPKQYLWPFPSDEMLVCPNLVQNEGY